MSETSEPDYANWVSSKLAVVPGILGLLLGLLIIVSPWFAPPALALLASSAYFAYARWRFSPQGGGIQSRIRGLLLEQLDWDGKGQVLDIGCGNGPLTIAIAKAYPQASVTGIDTWGASWEYSKELCERNAAIAGVSGSVKFERASAAALPYSDGVFDPVVSNLVFHEVRVVRDKRLLIREALRVLRKGGLFVIQDLFLWKQIFGDPGALVGQIRDWGTERVKLVPTNRSEFIPRALRLPFMVGTIAILKGKK
jgi:SAM-dependent methyltransferase